MYPSKEQLALIKQCRALWGKDNVRMTGPTERDTNVYVKCKGKASLHRMTYASDGTIVASSLDMAMQLWDETGTRPGNAIDN